MRVYLDNCCYNRPFDDQKQLRIRLEAEAKLHIQNAIVDKKIELVWSYILDFENSANPFKERRNSIRLWRNHAIIDINETIDILSKADEIIKKGIKSKDALHVACAVEGNSDYFLTTDDDILKRLERIRDIKVIDPVNFIRSFEL